MWIVFTPIYIYDIIMFVRSGLVLLNVFQHITFYIIVNGSITLKGLAVLSVSCQ